MTTYEALVSLDNAHLLHPQHHPADHTEPVIFERIPELERIKADLSRHGAKLALLTGTGSVVFGIFENDQAAEAAERAIKSDFRNLKTSITRTRSPLTP
jgi:4-diphosphocytidyl-2C-methyl-D-erythritol kinase